MAELKNALRSGDIWVHGSRQFRGFEDYLLSRDRFAAMRSATALRLAAAGDLQLSCLQPAHSSNARIVFADEPLLLQRLMVRERSVRAVTKHSPWLIAM